MRLDGLRFIAAQFLVVLAASSGTALAQQDVVERLDRLQELSERDSAAALTALTNISPILGSTTPYFAKRKYLTLLINVELDAAHTDGADKSIAGLLKLAQDEHDDVGIVLATSKAAYRMMRDGKAEAAILKLVDLEPVVARAADTEALWSFYMVLAESQLVAGKFEQALANANKSIAYAKQLPKLAEFAQVKSLNMLSRIYMVVENWGKAVAVIDEALTVANAIGATRMQGTLYLNRGYVYGSIHDVAKSRAAYELANEIGRKAGLVRLQANALNNICDSYLQEKNFTKVEVLCGQALEKFKEAGDLGGISIARSNIGLAKMGLGKVAEGAASVRAAMQFGKDAGAATDEEAVLGELGAMYEHLGMYREANSVHREQAKLSAVLFRTERDRTIASLQELRGAQVELLARDNSLKDAEISNHRLQQKVTILGATMTLLAGTFIFLLYRRGRKTNKNLVEANQQLEFYSVRDPLTGLFNRRSFLELMKKRPIDGLGVRRENDSPDGLMILDIDHFKNINDTLGHAGGDIVLVEIAKRLRTTVRDTDMVIRWGGEEFLIYSPKATAYQLKALATRVLQAVGVAPIKVGEKSWSVTVTGGFLTLPFSGLSESECNWEKAMHIADMALYLGKVNGRNRAYGFNELHAPLVDVMSALEVDISSALNPGLLDSVELLGPTK